MTDYRRVNDANQGAQDEFHGNFNSFRFDVQDLMIERQAATTDNLKMPLFMVRDMSSTFLTIDKALLYVGDNSTFQKRITWILVIQWVYSSIVRLPLASWLIQWHIFSECHLSIVESHLLKYTLLALITQPVSFLLSFFVFNLLARFQQLSNLVSIVTKVKKYIQSKDFFFWEAFLVDIYLAISHSEQEEGIHALNQTCDSQCSYVEHRKYAPLCRFSQFQHFCSFLFLHRMLHVRILNYSISIHFLNLRYNQAQIAVRFKTISINMLTMVWAGTPMFLALMGLIPTWRYAFLMFAAIWVCTLPFAYFFFLQSPRYLLSKKQYNGVRQIFAKISKTNRRPSYQFKLVQEIDIENQSYLRLGERMYSKISDWAPVRQYNYLDLFRFSSVKKATFLLMFLWTFRFFIYYATNLALQSVLQSGFWLTLAISTSSLSEVIGTFGISIITFIFKHRWSTMQVIRTCLIGLTILCGLLFLLPIQGQCKTFQKYDVFCLSILGMVVIISFVKFTNSIFFGSLIHFSSEAYPTVVRSLGYGFTLTFGRMTTFFVPLYVSYMRFVMQKYNALCCLSAVALLGFLFCLLFPAESTPMLTTIPQEDQQLKEQRQLRDIEMALLNPNIIMGKQNSKGAA